MLARMNGKKEEHGLKMCKMGCWEVVKREVVKRIEVGCCKD